MSFDAREQSLAAGQPVRLYQFSRGVMRWLYNTSDRDITWNNQIFRTVRGGIIDSGIIQSGDPEADKQTITGPADLEVAQLFRGVPPSDEIELVIYDMHFGDDEALVSWMGSIAGVNWPNVDSSTITCVTFEASMQQPGLTDCYSRTCIAVLGDSRCKVILSQYMVSAPIQGSTGSVISAGAAAAYPDGYFTGGFAEWPVGSGNYDRRHIEQHQGSSLTILAGTSGMPTSGVLRLYPGCDYLPATCRDKFNNEPNFRGEPQLQGESPYDGNQVF
ncbi:phage BR0599 family protein [Pseudomonas citronellolis]|uniref:phage BR0599 family protein n=1 Tax=Pseudomonas citronellolis TaxID=53408 RepID=UPI0023E43DD9|nr:phage BR0599 family protein [Pseudomonas citronellolis]MDF3932928.1 phage BR0599 family protein [Pseudomonas citronellolis]